MTTKIEGESRVALCLQSCREFRPTVLSTAATLFGFKTVQQQKSAAFFPFASWVEFANECDPIDCFKLDLIRFGVRCALMRGEAGK